MPSRIRLSLALLLAFALSACPPSGDSGGSSGGIETVDQSSLVTVITADDCKNLDPHDTGDGGNVKVIRQVYETLIYIDPNDNGTLIGGLAESWEVSEDSKTITFKLREGVTFHDGEAMDGAAVKKSLDRWRKADPKLPLANAPYAGEMAFTESIAAEGMTVTLQLKHPVARVALRNLTMFCAAIVSPKALAAIEGKDAQAGSAHLSKNPAGTGPYQVDAFDAAGKTVRLVAFDGCWRGKPQVRTLVFKSVPDEQVRLEQLKSKGAVFLDDVPRQHWDRLSKTEGLTLKSNWSLNLCYLGVNAIHEATKEPEVRKAIQLALDRSKIVEHYEGTARPTFSMVAQPMPEYDPELRIDGWDDDLAKRQAAAKALLEKANAVGRKITVYFPQQARPYLPRPQDIADTIRQQLKAVGFDAEIKGEDKNKLFPGIKTDAYELVVIGWTTDNADADNFYSPLCDGVDGKPANYNCSRKVDPEVSKMLVAARAITDTKERQAAYRAIERRLQNGVRGYVPLVNTKVAMVYTNNLEGLEIDGLGSYRFHNAKVTK